LLIIEQMQIAKKFQNMTCNAIVLEGVKIYSVCCFIINSANSNAVFRSS